MQIKYFIPGLIFLASCAAPDTKKTTLNNDVLSECNTAIQNAIVVDHVSAPVGSRRYYYATVAAYEALVPFHKGYKSLAGQLKGLGKIDYPDTSKGYCLDLVALSAHTYVSQKVVYKEDSIINFRNRKLRWYKDKLNKQVYENSIKWGETMGDHIAKWAKKDSFDQIRGRDFYIVKKGESNWQPTSPDFADAVEPNWNKLRTAAAPTPSYFPIKDPEPFNKDKSSRFYAITKQVYDQVKNQDSTTLAIALYWDDNPNTTFHIGHATINVLKASPAGHWLGMFSTVARQKKYSLMESAEGFARLSAAIFDAFIICWDAKYRTEYIRPETAIRRLIDSSWTPPIQTPAFPEYPSGHTVVSNTAATVLTHYFGNFQFIDSANYAFGLGIRKFNNFFEAADEACISRLYGGIHFIDAIDNGRGMGQSLGKYHLENIKTKE